MEDTFRICGFKRLIGLTFRLGARSVSSDGHLQCPIILNALVLIGVIGHKNAVELRGSI
ncbi:hypothetical protein D3C80_368150 [compost metagenome]